METELKSSVPIRVTLKHIWRGVRPFKWSLFAVFILLFSVEIISVITPIFYKDFFDLLGQGSGVPSRDLITVIIYIAGLNIGVLVLNRMRGLVNDTTSTGINEQLRRNAYDYLMRHSYSFFVNNFAGSLIQRVNRFAHGFDKLLDGLVYTIVPLLIAVVGSVIVTWQLAPVISIIIAVWVVGYSIFSYFFSHMKLKYDEKVAEADTAITAHLSDTITNHSAVTLFTAYDHERQSFKEINQAHTKAQLKSWHVIEWMNLFYNAVLYTVEFAVFYCAIYFWGQGLLTIGTFVLIQVYVIGIGHKIGRLTWVVRMVSESISDSSEMAGIMEMPLEIRDIPHAPQLVVSKSTIKFDRVGFAFNQTRDVITDLNLEIKGGEKVALVGPSGAGKTTLIRLILRLYDVASGAITIDDQNIAKVTQESLHRAISLVPQDPVLFHRTLLENIRYGRADATDEEVIAAAKLAHCDEFIDVLPLKYHTFVGERGIKLSGGERQRIAIARAILKNAPILILDEATSSLDSHSEALIQDALDTLMKGCTTIVIAHRLSTIRKMDRIIGLQNGTVIEQGTHDELIARTDGLYAKLWKLQVSGFIS